MTISRNIGRGGARLGSGRKKKPTAPPLPDIPVSSGRAAQALARRHVDLAIATLVHIAANGQNEASRVSAAKHIIEVAAKGQPESDDAISDGWDDLLQRARGVN